jgi:PAS domain S-box-containing protein
MVSPRIVPLLPTTEAALNLLELLLDKSYDSILITDSAKDQKIIYCNAAFEQLTGYTAAEMIGKSPKLLQGPSTDRDETERLGRSLLEHGSFEGQAINYKKNGTPFMMSWRVDPIIVENKAIAWLAIQREVAMQWQAE